jgi:hypothetical protein
VILHRRLDSLKRGRQMLAGTAKCKDKIQCFMCLGQPVEMLRPGDV